MKRFEIKVVTNVQNSHICEVCERYYDAKQHYTFFLGGLKVILVGSVTLNFL